MKRSLGFLHPSLGRLFPAFLFPPRGITGPEARSRLLRQTHAPGSSGRQTPGPRTHRQDVEFLMHVGSLGEFDVASFGFAIHELMVRVGAAPNSGANQIRLTDQQLWAAMEAGLIWLRRLHSLIPAEGDRGGTMSDRIENEGLEPLMSDLRSAARRTRWGGGLPVWLVALNVLACTGLIVILPLILTGSIGSSVKAAEDPSFLYQQRVVDLEAQLRATIEDTTFRQELMTDVIAEMRSEIEALKEQLNE